MRSSLFLLLAVAALGCASNPIASVSVSPEATSAGPISAEVENGLFRLQFELGSATWRADEPITGFARVERLGAGDTISGCGPLGFVYKELGGDHRHMEPVWPACCGPTDLTQGDEITSPLNKSGSIAEGPDAAFWTPFFEGDDVRLPAGIWEITAVTSFHDGPECAGSNQRLTVPLQVTVEG